MKSIVLCDNQEITRFALSKLLVDFDGVDQVHEASNKKSLFHLLELCPHSLVCLDYTLFDFVSLDELIIIETRFQTVNWILFCDELSPEFIRTLLYSTSSFSVLLKDSSINEISMCFKDVLKDRRFICNQISNLLLENSKQTDLYHKQSKLTHTEQEILKEIALGKTTKDIAGIRYVSVHTVMTHRKNIFRKLGVNNVHEATKYAMRSGLIDMADYYI